ncbi:MAG: toll/interleukin-1 receptor domain-containing protein [Calothrix sp. MO_167.B42]|nr:toll/interleukin-1 receptor domain-containing protein [Calothrix sp. MO_167.B42]
MPDQSEAKITQSQPEFDVFLAHNSQDKQQVEEIAEALRLRGMKPWLDKEQIPPGVSFSDAIQAAIPKCKVSAVFIGSNGLGKWEEEEYKLSITLCVEKKIPLIPVLLPGVDEIPEEIKNKLRFGINRKYVSFHERTNEVEALDELEWGITQRRPVKKRYRILVNVAEPQKNCFLAMPKQGLDSIYKAVQKAAKNMSVKQPVGNIGIQMLQTRDRTNAGFVEDIAHIISGIRSSEIVVGVCVSEDKYYQPDPDVIYELGLAHALGKPLCIITNQANHNSLSNYILKDIPQEEFIDYELSEIDDGKDLSEKVKNKLEVIINSLEFPYLVEPRNRDIIAIDWEKSQCFLPPFRDNFCNILNFGLEIHKQFSPLQNLLTSLYKEVEEVADTLQDPTSTRNINKEIDDAIKAWREYKQEYQGLNLLNQTASELRKVKQYFENLNREISGTNQFVAQFYIDYKMVIQLIEDYPDSHKLLSSILEKDDVINRLHRVAQVHTLCNGINNLIEHIELLIYKGASNMVKNLAAMICHNEYLGK